MNDLKWMSNTDPSRAKTLSTRFKDENGNPTGPYPAGVFQVQSWSEETLAKKLAAVDRKLVKYGHPVTEPIQFTKRIHTVVGYDTNEDGKAVEVVKAKIPYIASLIYIEAARIQLGDRKQLVGTVERVGDSDDLVVKPLRSAGDDAEAVNRLAAKVGREIRCDHCKSNRRRNAAYILQGEDGNLFMVASSCGKAFFGQNVAGLLNDLLDVEDKDWHGAWPVDRAQKIALTVAAIMKHGFVGRAATERLNDARTAAGLGSIKTTSEFVGQLECDLEGRTWTGISAQEEREVKERQTTAQALVKEFSALAADVIEGISQTEPADAFQANVVAAVRSMAYSKDWNSNTALIVAGVANYLKATGAALPDVWAFNKPEVKPEQPVVVPFVDSYLAPVGINVHLIGTVEQVRQMDGYMMLVLRSERNHKVLYFGNAKIYVEGKRDSYSISDLQIGTKVNTFGTVKANDQRTFRGVTELSTVLTRPNFTVKEI